MWRGDGLELEAHQFREGTLEVKQNLTTPGGALEI